MGESEMVAHDLLKSLGRIGHLLNFGSEIHLSFFFDLTDLFLKLRLKNFPLQIDFYEVLITIVVSRISPSYHELAYRAV